MTLAPGTLLQQRYRIMSLLGVIPSTLVPISL